MIRKNYLHKIKETFQVHPVCALLGARQVGKTTLAHQFINKTIKNPKNVHFFDLEDPLDLARLENPMLTFSALEEGLIVIDEIQRKPELFPILRVLVDKKNNTTKFLILGSASRDLISQSSETLAGRIGYIELPPFSLSEVENSTKLFMRGGFPRSYLAQTESNSYNWRRNYITTFLERDIPNLGFSIPPQQMRRFWMMLAHYHGQILNVSNLANSLNLSSHTIKKYIDILCGTFMIRTLQPWFENIKKRQIKTPKLYFRDSGILFALLTLETKKQILSYPNLGAFWEGFAVEEIIRITEASHDEYFFWATQSGAEVDLFITKGGKRFGFEFKHTDKPSMTKSMHSGIENLKLNHLFLIYPGDKLFPLSETVTACGLDTITTKKFHDLLK
jgi:hypothetical protein